MTNSVLLASSSRFRHKLCQRAMPDDFKLLQEKLSPDIDEKAIRREDPKEMVVAIAKAKAEESLLKLAARELQTKPDFIICCDQVIVHDGSVREKPESKQQAKEHLQSYGKTGKPAQCISGVVVVNLKTKRMVSGVDVAEQFWNEVPDSIAEALLDEGEIMHCAGSFVVEHELLQPYVGKRIGEIESVQGMPIALTQRLLLEATNDTL